jgi:hypothetical protein
VRKNVVVSENILFVNMSNIRDAVSIQSLIQYFGLSDCEYIKSCFITYIIYCVCAMIKLDNLDLKEAIDQDFIFHALRIG